MVGTDFINMGPLITIDNFTDRSRNGPYCANVHVQTHEGVKEYEMELTYKGKTVKRMFGSHEDIPILMMAAINEHQLDLGNSFD